MRGTVNINCFAYLEGLVQLRAIFFVCFVINSCVILSVVAFCKQQLRCLIVFFFSSNSVPAARNLKHFDRFSFFSICRISLKQHVCSEIPVLLLRFQFLKTGETCCSRIFHKMLLQEFLKNTFALEIDFLSCKLKECYWNNIPPAKFLFCFYFFNF